LRFDPDDSMWPNRARFVLSKGHASRGAGHPPPMCRAFMGLMLRLRPQFPLCGGRRQ
jgi:hypothetical protein